MDVASNTFETIWVNKHELLKEVSADPELSNEIFRTSTAYFSIHFYPGSPRCHNKLGSVERKHAVVKALCFRSMQYAEDSNLGRAVEQQKVTFAEVVSRSTYPRNVLYASKAIGNIEMARGYTLVILGL